MKHIVRIFSICCGALLFLSSEAQAARDRLVKTAEDAVSVKLAHELDRVDRLKPAPPEELKKVLAAMRKAVDPEDKGKFIEDATLLYTTTLDGRPCAIEMRTIFKDPDKVKNIVTIPSAPDSTEAWNGTRGWRMRTPPGLVEKLSGRDVAVLKLQARNAAPGNHLEDVFPRIVLAGGTVRVGTGTYYSLSCYPPPELKLEPLRLIVDTKTMRTARVLSITHTDQGPRVSETVYGEYKKFGDIYLPETMRTHVAGFHLNAVLRDCRFNFNPDDALFEPPNKGN